MIGPSPFIVRVVEHSSVHCAVAIYVCKRTDLTPLSCSNKHVVNETTYTYKGPAQ